MSVFTSGVAGRWVESLSPELTKHTFKGGPRVDEMPDRLVVATLLSGAGLSNEGVLDRPILQVLTRGAPDNSDDAEQAALVVDERLIFHSFPAEFEGVYIQSVQRSGGRPAHLYPQGDDGRRYALTCNYVVSVATDV